MNIPCNRCFKDIYRPDKRNAKYVIGIDLDKDKVLVKRCIIVCPTCVKESDDVIW